MELISNLRAELFLQTPSFVVSLIIYGMRDMLIIMLVPDGESHGREYRPLKVKLFVAFLVILLPLTLVMESKEYSGTF